MSDNKAPYTLICTIVNRGFSDDVMDAAREAGAKGGTVVYSHGAGMHEDNSFFGLSIHPEKELVIILADEETRKPIMKSIVDHIGLTSEGAGITFSLPVTHIGGIARLNNPDFSENSSNDD